MIKIYLDNCCFNRPYDDQSQLRISLETQAKLYIQNLIKDKRISMVTSYVLQYENSKNPFTMRKQAIDDFLKSNTSSYIGISEENIIKERAELIMSTGIKTKDAYHIACAIEAKCDYFLSTDDRLLKYRSDNLQLMDPIEFIKEWEAKEIEQKYG